MKTPPLPEREAAVFRFFLVFRLQLYGASGGEEEEHALLDRLAEDAAQGRGVGRQLSPVESSAGGDLLLGFHPVGLVVDDDQAVLFPQAAVHHALEQQLLPGAAVKEIARVAQQGELELPMDGVGAPHAPG